jgi:hypothetical protein
MKEASISYSRPNLSCSSLPLPTTPPFFSSFLFLPLSLLWFPFLLRFLHLFLFFYFFPSLTTNYPSHSSVLCLTQIQKVLSLEGFKQNKTKREREKNFARNRKFRVSSLISIANTITIAWHSLLDVCTWDEVKPRHWHSLRSSVWKKHLKYHIWSATSRSSSETCAARWRLADLCTCK